MPGKHHKTLSWPPGHRECRDCKKILSSEHFTPFKRGAGGLYPYCKECRKPGSKIQWANKNPKTKILDRVKTRATKKGWEFDLTLEDIPDIPAICPVLKTPMLEPSVDRIDSDRGYTKDNIRIISNRANTLKNNATLEELELLLEDAKRIAKDNNNE